MKLIFDTETTGLNPEIDEIIQFSAIDEFENTLLNCYIKPSHTKSWEQASAVNGITPEIVKDKPYFDFYKEQIQWLFDRADELISYNGQFDIQMLKAHGITIRNNIKHYDVMQEFAPIYGDYNEKHQSYTWKKLSVCADYYGFEFKAHDSLEDIKATLYCYKQIMKNEKDN